MNPEKPLRLFVAIELPAGARSALHRLIQQLRAAMTGPLRWVSASNVHLTLKFLGDVPPQRVDELDGALRQGVQACRPFDLELSNPGVFPERQPPRVVWTGLAEDIETLRRVQQAVEQGMGGLGFPGEARRFSPHLTLARVKGPLRPEELARLHEALEQAGKPEAETFRVTGIAVMQSRLTPSGAVYRRLREVRLRGE